MTFTSKGFALIEIVIAVVMTSIISLVISPQFLDLVPSFKQKAAQGERGEVESALNVYRGKTGFSQLNSVSNPSLDQLLMDNGWVDNAAHSGVCGGSGYLIPTFTDDNGTQATTQRSDKVAVTGTPVIDPTCPSAATVNVASNTGSNGSAGGPNTNINVLAPVPRGWRSNTEPPLRVTPVFDPSYLPDYIPSAYPGYYSSANFYFLMLNGFPDQPGSVFNGINNQTNDYYNYFRYTHAREVFTGPFISSSFIKTIFPQLNLNSPQVLNDFCKLNGYNNFGGYTGYTYVVYCSGTKDNPNALSQVSNGDYTNLTGDTTVFYDECPAGYVLDGSKQYSRYYQKTIACRLVDRTAYVPTRTDYRCPKGYKDTQYDGFTGNEAQAADFFNSDITKPFCQLNQTSQVQCPTGYVSKNGGCYLP